MRYYEIPIFLGKFYVDVLTPEYIAMPKLSNSLAKQIEQLQQMREAVFFEFHEDCCAVWMPADTSKTFNTSEKLGRLLFENFSYEEIEALIAEACSQRGLKKWLYVSKEKGYYFDYKREE